MTTKLSRRWAGLRSWTHAAFLDCHPSDKCSRRSTWRSRTPSPTFPHRTDCTSHFALRAAIGDLIGVDEAPLEAPKYDIGDDALRIALVAFADVLSLSERDLQHGLTHAVGAIVTRLMREDDAGS